MHNQLLGVIRRQDLYRQPALYTLISNELNLNGYKTRAGCLYTPETIRRLVKNSKGLNRIL